MSSKGADGRFLQPVRPGDLVFGVGANEGEYSEIYANEGARVVAVEPNTAFRGRLEALARSCKAVADAPGTAVLHVCTEPASARW